MNCQKCKHPINEHNNGWNVCNHRDCNCEETPETIASALEAEAATLRERVRLLEEALHEMTGAARRGVGHVAAANYPEREREAAKWISDVQNKYAALLKGETTK